MKFVKKLYIMTGQGQGKGAVTVERNAFGTTAEVAVYNLRHTDRRRYFAFVSDRARVFPMAGKSRFDLGDAALDNAHAAVVSVVSGELVVELYGTDGAKRMWQGNLCDRIRGLVNGFETEAVQKSDSESAQAEEDTQELLNLFPSPDAPYDDGAVAKVNYYSNIYSARQKTDAEIAFERSRLEELGNNLIKARLDMDAVCPPKEGKHEADEDFLRALKAAARENELRERAAAEVKSLSSDAPLPVSHGGTGKRGETEQEPAFAAKPLRRAKEEADTTDAADEAVAVLPRKNAHAEEAAAATDAVSAVAGDALSPFSRYIYSYRNELLKRQETLQSASAAQGDADGERVEERQGVQDGEKREDADRNAAASKDVSVNAMSEAGSGVPPNAGEASETAGKPRRDADATDGGERDNAVSDDDAPQPDTVAGDAPASEEKSRKKAVLKRSADETAEEDAPVAPKADLSKSEAALKNAKPEKLNFYERVKSQLDRLFESNPRDAMLEKLLPSSRFVRVSVENSEKYYCVGLVGKPDYICYAVPAAYTAEPPEELDGYCQWLPSDAAVPTGSGFWLLYQDAVTGDSVS